jgi:hypothetical protein
VAQRVEVRLTDDLRGAEIPCGRGEMVTFSLDGTSYEIDLTGKNASVLRKGTAAVHRRWSADSGFTPATPGPYQGRRRCSYRQGVGSRQWLPGARARGRVPNEVLAVLKRPTEGCGGLAVHVIRA